MAHEFLSNARAVTPIHYFQDEVWATRDSADKRELEDLVEAGGVLSFPRLPFRLLAHEERFLDPRFGDGKAKNISLRPARVGGESELRGASASEQDARDLRAMIVRFGHDSDALVARVLPHYAAHVRAGGTTFRPQRVEGRATSWRKDDTRLHVDAFPSNPTRGTRLLRVFTNVNPSGQPRSWRVGESFEQFAARFLPSIAAPVPGFAHLLKGLGVTKARRTAYDHYMLRLHDAVKADLAYQREAPQLNVDFAPGTTWIVFSDQVLHAAMGGQYMFEQTYFLDSQFLKNAETSPRGVLERLLGRPLHV